MTRKIIIDCDPGIDDAVALAMALFDPRLEVLAITATAGTVDAERSTNNVSAILDKLDPPKYPRIGKALSVERGALSDERNLNGSDGLGECHFEGSQRQHQSTSDKVICDLVRQYPNEVTILCLGPLTNLAKLLQRDPAAIPLINKLVIAGGTVQHPGNITPAAEFNMHFDAESADEVFSSATTKTLVPLDIAETVTQGVELLEQLPSKYTRAGDLLHKILPFAFRTAHQKLGREMIPCHSAITLLAVLYPELFQWRDVPGKVETEGKYTRGATVFDLRLRPEWQPNMEVAIDVDIEEIETQLIRGLRYAGQQT